MSRLPTERIEIPSRELRQEAGQIVIEALKEAGLDPYKSLTNSLICSIIQAWGRNEYDRCQVVSMLKKLLILNPSLALKKE